VRRRQAYASWRGPGAAVADEVSDVLWGPTVTSLAPDLVLAAGDLPWDYLEYLTTVPWTGCRRTGT
jgi:hypothetical protein